MSVNLREFNKPDSLTQQHTLGEVWTIWVRLSHALVAVGITSLWYLVEFHNETGPLHRVIGYGITVVVVCRIAYGIWARRLSDQHHTSRLCWPAWKAVRQHLIGLSKHQLAPHIGHNPLGQYAIYWMWGMILLLAFTGWLSRTDAYWGDDAPVNCHAILSNGLWVMLILHLMAIVWVGHVSKQGLIKQMITGKFSLKQRKAKSSRGTQ